MPGRASFRTLLAFMMVLVSAFGARTADRSAVAMSAPIGEAVMTQAAHSYALVIGIDAYRNGWPRLANAVKDARLVAKALQGQGFTVTLKTDLSSDALKSKMEDFIYEQGRDPNSQLLLWFAGHGHTIDGEAYLVGADAPPSAYDMIRKGGFEVASVPEPSSLFGYMAVDAVVRAMAGQEPAHFVQPVFLIVKDNVESEGGKNNEFVPSNNFACHYVNIWKGTNTACK